MPQTDEGLKSIAALPEIRAVLDAAPTRAKADISRIKKLLADRDAVLSVPDIAVTLDEAKAAFAQLTIQTRQLRRWHHEPISDAERAEVVRLQAAIPEIRPLIQRLIALATELDQRARTGLVSPRKKWRH